RLIPVAFPSNSGGTPARPSARESRRRVDQRVGRWDGRMGATPREVARHHSAKLAYLALCSLYQNRAIAQKVGSGRLAGPPRRDATASLSGPVALPTNSFFQL